MERVVVVGASLAGLNACQALREGGHDGPITVVEAATELPSDRPPLSKQVLSGDWEPERASQPLAGEIDRLALDLRLGTRATGLRADNRVLATSAGDLPYDGLVIAAGATPRRLPGQPHLAGMHELRTLADSLALRADLEARPRRVVVVGAGFIGAEVAATCRGRSLDVTVVEALAVPMGRVFGDEVGGAFAALHRSHGVDLRLGVGVFGFRGDQRVEAVELTDGSVVEADVVVVGVGVSPAASWLEGSGVTIDDGVVCDETLLAAPGVVAAGDICRWRNPRYGDVMRIEHWEHAVEQGRAAGTRLLAEARGEAGVTFGPVPWFWSDQYDRKIQFVGRTAGADEARVVDGSLEDMRFVALYRRGDQVLGALGVNRPAKVAKLRAQLVSGLSWDAALAAFGPA